MQFELLSEMSSISGSSHMISDLEIIVMWLCPEMSAFSVTPLEGLPKALVVLRNETGSD